MTSFTVDWGVILTAARAARDASGVGVPPGNLCDGMGGVSTARTTELAAPSRKRASSLFLRDLEARELLVSMAISSRNH
jgi:hypothetical protein